MQRSATGVILLAVLAAALTGPVAAAKKGEVVVLEHGRWLDTLRGTVKNFSARPARDVTLVVRFLDKKRKLLGTQRVTLGDLQSGDEADFDVSIQGQNRPATAYEFAVHAIWR